MVSSNRVLYASSGEERMVEETVVLVFSEDLVLRSTSTSTRTKQCVRDEFVERRFFFLRDLFFLGSIRIRFLL